MGAFIIGAEVAFWVLIALGLAVRYLLKWRRTSVAVLLAVPLVDIVLLAASVWDMRRGADADLSHALAALYLGYSVVFGHGVIKWADQRVSHRWFGGPEPVKPPKYGMARAAHEWRWAVKSFISWSIAMGVVWLMTFLVDAPERTEPLIGWVSTTVKIPGIAALIALTYTLWPKKQKERKPA